MFHHIQPSCNHIYSISISVRKTMNYYSKKTGLGHINVIFNIYPFLEWRVFMCVNKSLFFRMYRRSRLNLGKSSQMTSFGSLLTTFEQATCFRLVTKLAEIGSSLKPNHHGQVKLVQIPDTHSQSRLNP